MAMQAFLPRCTEQFDLILASNIFHIMDVPKLKSIFQLIKKVMHEKTVLLGQVKYQDNGSKFTEQEYQQFKEFFSTVFPEAEYHEYFVVGEWRRTVFLNRGGLLGASLT